MGRCSRILVAIAVAEIVALVTYSAINGINAEMAEWNFNEPNRRIERLGGRLVKRRHLYVGLNTTKRQLTNDEAKSVCDIIGQIATLETVCLRGPQFNDESLRCLRRLKHIMNLELFDTSVTGTGILYLDESVGLQSFMFCSDDRDLTKEAWDHLAKMPIVGHVHVVWKGTELPHIAELKHLQSLGLEILELHDANLAPLHRASELKELKIMTARLPKELVYGLSRIPALARLTVSMWGASPQNIGPSVLPEIANCHGLQEIEMRNVILTPADHTALRNLGFCFSDDRGVWRRMKKDSPTE